MSTRYAIMVDSGSFELQEKVRNMIEEGWEPIGGVSATNKGFQQAMTRKPSVVAAEPELIKMDAPRVRPSITLDLSKEKIRKLIEMDEETIKGVNYSGFDFAAAASAARAELEEEPEVVPVPRIKYDGVKFWTTGVCCTFCHSTNIVIFDSTNGYKLLQCRQCKCLVDVS